MLWIFRDRIANGKPIDKLKIVNIPSAIVNQQRRLTNLRKDAKAAHTRAVNKIKRKKGGGVARVAVMRRMATILWHMLTKRKTYAEVRSLGIGLET